MQGLEFSISILSGVKNLIDQCVIRSVVERL